MLRNIPDRRKAERHAVSRIAKIQIGAGTLPRDCLITDISDGGLRLHAEGFHVPATFTIWVEAQRRDCSVVWRLGHEIGARFVDGAQPGFGRRTATALSR